MELFTGGVIRSRVPSMTNAGFAILGNCSKFALLRSQGFSAATIAFKVCSGVSVTG